MMKPGYAISVIAGGLFCGLFQAPYAQAQQAPPMNGQARQQVADMLHQAYDEVKKHYYDPKIEGMDWDARYKQYTMRVQNARDLGEGFLDVASFLFGLHDSHTFFVPPRRATRYDPGYRFLLEGNDVYISRLRPGTEAASKLHVGDKVLALNNMATNRSTLHETMYYFNTLAPQPVNQLSVETPTGERGQVTVNAAAKTERKTLDMTSDNDYYDIVRLSENEDHASRSQIYQNGDIAIWKLQQFDLDIDGVEQGIGKARKHKTLILDLRDNPGGAVESLKLMVGSLFDHDVKIADRVGRKDMKPIEAKHHGQPFEGKLIVLVNGGSASAAELLARVVQLEHRGTVIGDKTSGAVMEAKHYSESQGAESKIFYHFSVTDANLMMSDGKSLEKEGVIPDEVMLPTGADLAAGRDVVLSRAAELGGVKLDPVEAGKLFPYEWLPL